MQIDLENVIVESGSAEEFNTEKNENTEQNTELDKSTDDSADNKDTIVPVSEDANEKIEEEVVETDTDEGSDSIISEIKNHFGYDIEGEFSEDINGLKTLTTEIAKKIALDEFQQVFEAYPDVAEYMQFRMNGGDPDKFLDLNKNIDYSTIQLDEDNLNQSKEIISTFLRKQGFTDEDIRDTISDYEDTGILAKQAKKILPKLQDLSVKEKQSILEQQEKQRQSEIEETKEHWKNIRSTIDSGKVKNIAIPEADKKKFFDWMALPKENNKSQRDIDREKMSLDDMIALEYLIYKGLDISKLAIAKQNTQETERLKSLLGSKGNKIKGTPTSTKKTIRDVGKLEEYIF
jgi:hypothetical protein